ncbi:MAG TPA: glycosyltransferase WbuB, partial [Anaerolineae bacterium]|nr:glycosyltransferase WbuB [Anaerolineae bacterium]
PPRDADAVAEALLRLLDRPAEAERMGQEARKLILQEYTWDHNARRVRQVYEEVCAR